MSDEALAGVPDSGALTVLHELLAARPHEHPGAAPGGRDAVGMEVR